MKDKVLLVNTLPRSDYWAISQGEPAVGIPYGLLCMGTVLTEAGFKVVIVDPQVDREFLPLIERQLEGCLFAGISAMTAGVASGLQIAARIRERAPGLPIVWGGIHPTLFPEQTLQDELVDIVVHGEGETTCLELAEAMKAGRPLETVRGIGFKKDGHMILAGPQEFIDLDAMPLPDYGLLDMDKYLYRDLQSLTVGKGRVKIVVVHSSRGCPYLCTFCINTHASQRFRAKSIERLLQEVDQVVRKYDPDVIYLQDDNFFANRARTRRFFEEYRKRGYRFRWFSLTRANYFHPQYLSDEFVGGFADSCLWLGLGVESGSARIREMIRKDITEEQVLTAAATLGRRRIPAGFAFMAGIPTESKSEMLATVSLMLKIRALHPDAQFAYQYFRPYPGSKLYETAVERGYHAPASLRQWAECQDIAVGYTRVEDLPWVAEPQLMKYLLGAVQYLFASPPDALRGMSLASWRLYRAFWVASFGLRNALGFWRGCGLELLGDRVARRLRGMLSRH